MTGSEKLHDGYKEKQRSTSTMVSKVASVQEFVTYRTLGLQSGDSDSIGVGPQNL